MKAEDLFPGAIVRDKADGGLVEIYGLDTSNPWQSVGAMWIVPGDPDGADLGWINPDRLEGVPLTPETLVDRFGAMHVENTQTYRINGYRSVYIWDHEGADFSLYEYGTPCIFQDIHQLQRLCHALQGEPLKMKQKA